MIEQVNETDFIQRFVLINRKENFSIEGRRALFNYLEEYEEDTGEQINFDPIALCCDYTEYESISDYLNYYKTDVDSNEYQELDDEEGFIEAVLEEIGEQTTLIKIDGTDGFIIQAY